MEGVTILVVDADSRTSRSVERALGSEAGRVVTAGSTGAARQLGGSFDVGVFGIELGSSSGVDLAEELLSEGKVGQVVFFSGAMWQAPLRRAAALGPVLPRDCDPTELAEELRRIVASGP